MRAIALVATLLLAVPGSVWAAEGASTEYIGGFTGFAAGYVPTDPGTYFSNYLYFYSASTSVVPVNGQPALDVSTDVYFEIAQFTWVTKYTLLGGNYGFGLGVPLGYVSVDVGVPPSGVNESTSAFGFGDAILVPALVAWHSGNFHSNFAISVFAPTGEYNKNHVLSLSKNFWAIDGSYAGSYLTETGFDLSGAVGYTVNFENPATHYKSGDVVHLDLAIGQNLSKQFKVGVVGYAVVQVTGDTGSGAVLGSFESDVYAAGLAGEYDSKIGSKDVSMQLRWYREFDAKNHLEGNAVYLTASLQL
jgi:hypothetical protein